VPESFVTPSRNFDSSAARGSLLALFFALVAVGCSDAAPNPASTVESGGMAGTAGMLSSGTAGAGSAGGGGVAGTNGGASGADQAGVSGSGGAPVCTTYEDESGYNLVIHIENKTTRTLYLGQEDKSCPVEPLFQVKDGARAELPSLTDCRTSCNAMMTSGPVACPLNCGSPTTIKLEPNQSLQIPWDGRFGVTKTLPQGCLGSAAAGPVTCVQAARIEPAFFTFSARAGSSVRCLDTSGNCSCTPNTSGGCAMAGSVISGTVYTTEFLVKLEPAETPYIGLVFKN